MTGPMIFGITCLAMMRAVPAPEATAASMNFSPANAHSLTAHDARHGEPAHRADRQEQQRFAAAEDDGQDMTKKISGSPLKISMIRIITWSVRPPT